jgi:hypothetical protein
MITKFNYLSKPVGLNEIFIMFQQMQAQEKKKNYLARTLLLTELLRGL